VNQAHQAVEHLFVQKAIGAIKLMKEIQYLECGHALLDSMRKMSLVQRPEKRRVQNVKLDTIVREEIEQSFNVSPATIVLSCKQKELHNSHALLENSVLTMEMMS